MHQERACGCGRTVTVKNTDHERDRQPLPWQGNTWAKSFNRRTLIEGLFSSTRYQSLSINRGFIRMTGLTATTALLAFALVGHNLVRLHA